MADTSAITLHSTWRGLIGSSFGAAIVAVAGVIMVIGNGFTVFPTIVLGAGLLFVATVVFDYPVASTFTPDGVERRMMLRRQHWSWSDVRQLSRARPGVTKGIRGLKHGGLVAVVGRRRYLLVDQCESRAEYDEVLEIIADQAADLGISGLGEPEDSVPPTWVSRRAKWAPDGARGR